MLNIFSLIFDLGHWIYSGTGNCCPPRRSDMGRKSREHRERRERRLQRCAELQDELKRLKEGDAYFEAAPNCPPELRESHLKDILAFESVESGTSLFDGLQEHGIDLPHPETLDEERSASKVEQVVGALLDLQIILVGYEHMSARQFYWTLWNQTLWEGCYVRRKTKESFTVIDVSHSIPKSDIMAILEEAIKAGSVH